MFVIEKLVRDHEARVEAWEEARDKWLDKQEYYSRGDYERRHPRPGHWIKNVGQAFFIGVLAAALIGTVIAVATGGEHHHKTAQKKEPAKVTVEQTGVKEGDKVQVVYGDYKDSVGVVVKVGSDSAIIKLTHSTYTKAMADADNRTGGQDDGTLLSISDLDNLVPYKEVK